MFLVLNSSNLIVDISTYAHYVKKQDNSVIVSCEKENADGIYSAHTDKFYPVECDGYSQDTYTLMEVNEVPDHVIATYYYYHAGEFYTTEKKQMEFTCVKALEDMSEIILDQEYRLTLLELGVSDNAV